MRAPNFGSSSLSLVCCPNTPAENNNIGAIRNYVDTGKFLSEALILASTNPQYDNRLFIESQVQ
jgi:hypothetical protein